MHPNGTITMNLDTRVARSKNQVSADLQGEAVILHLKAGKYYSMNPVGSRIWDLIEKPVSIHSLIETIMNEYEVDSKRCEQDIIDLLTRLENAALIEIEVEAVINP